MNVTTVLEPTVEPVTLAQVYSQLKLDPFIESSDSPTEYSHPLDSQLRGNITTARKQVEDWVRRCFVEQTLRLSMPGFPGSCWPWRGAANVPPRIRLVRPPVIAVSSVRYYDTDNALQTVSPADYYVTDEQVPELRFLAAFAAPTVYDRPDALRVEYRAGYVGTGSPPTSDEEKRANVPQVFKDAILVGVEMLQGDAAPADREALERMWRAMLDPYVLQLVP